jgi:hypothetical protein
MNHARLLVLLALALVFAVAQAEETSLPAMGYTGSLEASDNYDLIKAEPLFAKLNKELIGSPIVLRVTHSLEPTGGGKAVGLASAIWAGSTLGLLPVVMNQDLVVYYDIMVNGTILTTYTFRKNITVSMNIWTKDKTHGLGDTGLAWVKTTARDFVAAVRQDPKVAELVGEYQFYFAGIKP